MPVSPQVLRLRNKHNVLRKFYEANDPRVIEVRRQLKEASITAYLERQMGEAPALDDDQVTRILALLRPGGSHDR